MARMTGGHLSALLLRFHGNGHAVPAVFVESGTFHGKTTRLAAAQFREVHTIELHPTWYAEAVEQLGALGVHCYHGNSAELVPTLARAIGEPVFWYLDAHWFKRVKDVAGQGTPLPLWAELEAIAARPYLDIVVVDDVHAFGGSDPTPEWLDVSLERIAGYFPGHREARIALDQAVVYR
jgi:hypothetical protein